MPFTAGGLDVGSKEVEPKYLVDEESFNLAEHFIDDHCANDGHMGHSEKLSHKWELANEIQMCIESYFEHSIYDPDPDGDASVATRRSET